MLPLFIACMLRNDPFMLDCTILGGHKRYAPACFAILFSSSGLRPEEAVTYTDVQLGNFFTAMAGASSKTYRAMTSDCGSFTVKRDTLMAFIVSAPWVKRKMSP